MREQIRKAVALLKAAKRPIVYAGGGVINAGPEASRLLTDFVHMTGFPCTNTLMGLGAFPSDDKQFLGMLGMHGTYEANLAMHDCDVMLNIGARFDDRVTGRLNAFSPGSKKIHVDIDPSSINKNVPVDVPIVGDAGRVLAALIAAWKADGQAQRQGGADRLVAPDRRMARQATACAIARTGKIIKPQHAVKRLYEITRELGRETFITTEVGQHQMWAAQYFGFEKPNRWMTSRRARHDGLRPAGGDGRADRASRCAGASTSPARPRS